MYTPETPIVTIDFSQLGVDSSGPPGGRPPGRLPNGQGGPATPGQGTAPINGNASTPIDGKTIKQGAIALAVTAALGGAAYFLYQDHQRVTLARNGGEDEPKKKRRAAAPSPDEDEDEDDDDGG